MSGAKDQTLNEMANSIENIKLTETKQPTADGDEEKAHRGIPEALFIEDVGKFIKESGNTSAEKVIKIMDELYGKYRFMEYSLSHRKTKLKTQIPDLKNSLAVVKELKKKKEEDETLSTNFMVSDNLYMKGTVPPTGNVAVWLGANVMLEYNLEDAEDLLAKNLANALTALDGVQRDLMFLREQITTTEVNMARLYNWDVKRRRTADGKEESA